MQSPNNLSHFSVNQPAMTVIGGQYSPISGHIPAFGSVPLLSPSQQIERIGHSSMLSPSSQIDPVAAHAMGLPPNPGIGYLPNTPLLYGSYDSPYLPSTQGNPLYPQRGLMTSSTFNPSLLSPVNRAGLGENHGIHMSTPNAPGFHTVQHPLSSVSQSGFDIFQNAHEVNTGNITGMYDNVQSLGMSVAHSSHGHKLDVTTNSTYVNITSVTPSVTYTTALISTPNSTNVVSTNSLSKNISSASQEQVSITPSNFSNSSPYFSISSSSTSRNISVSEVSSNNKDNLTSNRRGSEAIITSSCGSVAYSPVSMQPQNQMARDDQTMDKLEQALLAANQTVGELSEISKEYLMQFGAENDPRLKGEKFFCLLCNYYTTRVDKVVQHLKAHRGNIKCEICGKAFIKIADKVRHMPTHTRGESGLMVGSHFMPTSKSSLIAHPPLHHSKSFDNSIFKQGSQNNIPLPDVHFYTEHSNETNFVETGQPYYSSQKSPPISTHDQQIKTGPMPLNTTEHGNINVNSSDNIENCEGDSTLSMKIVAVESLSHQASNINACESNNNTNITVFNESTSACTSSNSYASSKSLLSLYSTTSSHGNSILSERSKISTRINKEEYSSSVIHGEGELASHTLYMNTSSDKERTSHESIHNTQMYGTKSIDENSRIEANENNNVDTSISTPKCTVQCNDSVDCMSQSHHEGLLSIVSPVVYNINEGLIQNSLFDHMSSSTRCSSSDVTGMVHSTEITINKVPSESEQRPDIPSVSYIDTAIAVPNYMYPLATTNSKDSEDKGATPTNSLLEKDDPVREKQVDESEEVDHLHTIDSTSNVSSPQGVTSDTRIVSSQDSMLLLVTDDTDDDVTEKNNHAKEIDKEGEVNTDKDANDEGEDNEHGVQLLSQDNENIAKVSRVLSTNVQNRNLSLSTDSPPRKNKTNNFDNTVCDNISSRTMHTNGNEVLGSVERLVNETEGENNERINTINHLTNVVEHPILNDICTITSNYDKEVGNSSHESEGHITETHNLHVLPDVIDSFDNQHENNASICQMPQSNLNSFNAEIPNCQTPIYYKYKRGRSKRAVAERAEIMDSIQYNSVNDEQILHTPFHILNSDVNIPGIGPLISRDPKSLRCVYCSYTGSSPKHLEKHYRAHATSYKVCRFCNKAFERPSDLVRHEQRHIRNKTVYGTESLGVKNVKFQEPSSGKVTFIKPPIALKKNVLHCRRCGFATTDQHVLNRHLAKNHRQQVFSCEFCTHKFLSEQALHNHITEVHSGPMPADSIRNNKIRKALKLWTCSLCEHSFGCRKELLAHMMEIHENDVELNQKLKNVGVKESAVDFSAERAAWQAQYGNQIDLNLSAAAVQFSEQWERVQSNPASTSNQQVSYSGISTAGFPLINSATNALDMYPPISPSIRDVNRYQEQHPTFTEDNPALNSMYGPHYAAQYPRMPIPTGQNSFIYSRNSCENIDNHFLESNDTDRCQIEEQSDISLNNSSEGNLRGKLHDIILPAHLCSKPNKASYAKQQLSGDKSSSQEWIQCNLCAKKFASQVICDIHQRYYHKVMVARVDTYKGSIVTATNLIKAQVTGNNEVTVDIDIGETFMESIEIEDIPDVSKLVEAKSLFCEQKHIVNVEKKLDHSVGSTGSLSKASKEKNIFESDTCSLSDLPTSTRQSQKSATDVSSSSSYYVNIVPNRNNIALPLQSSVSTVDSNSSTELHQKSSFQSHILRKHLTSQPETLVAGNGHKIIRIANECPKTTINPAFSNVSLSETTIPLHTIENIDNQEVNHSYIKGISARKDKTNENLATKEVSPMESNERKETNIPEREMSDSNQVSSKHNIQNNRKESTLPPHSDLNNSTDSEKTKKTEMSNDGLPMDQLNHRCITLRKSTEQTESDITPVHLVFNTSTKVPPLEEGSNELQTVTMVESKKDKDNLKDVQDKEVVGNLTLSVKESSKSDRMNDKKVSKKEKYLERLKLPALIDFKMNTEFETTEQEDEEQSNDEIEPVVQLDHPYFNTTVPFKSKEIKIVTMEPVIRDEEETEIIEIIEEDNMINEMTNIEHIQIIEMPTLMPTITNVVSLNKEANRKSVHKKLPTSSGKSNNLPVLDEITEINHSQTVDTPMTHTSNSSNEGVVFHKDMISPLGGNIHPVKDWSEYRLASKSNTKCKPGPSKFAAYRCPKCSYGTNAIHKYRQHEQAHEHGKYVCKICDKACIKSCDLVRHWVSHGVKTPEGAFKCDSCSFSDHDKEILERHMLCHYYIIKKKPWEVTNSKPETYEPKLDGKVWLSRKCRQKSTETPSKKSRKVLGGSLDVSDSKPRKVPKTLSPVKVKCSMCDDLVPRLLMSAHVREHHGTTKATSQMRTRHKSKYYCPKCGLGFSDPNEMLTHNFVEHDITDFENQNVEEGYNEKQITKVSRSNESQNGNNITKQTDQVDTTESNIEVIEIHEIETYDTNPLSSDEAASISKRSKKNKKEGLSKVMDIIASNTSSEPSEANPDVMLAKIMNVIATEATKPGGDKQAQRKSKERQKQSKSSHTSLRYKCSFCGIRFATYYKHQKHIKNEHWMKEEEVMNQVKPFGEQTVTQSSGENPYACDICGKTFAVSQSLYLHRLKLCSALVPTVGTEANKINDDQPNNKESKVPHTETGDTGGCESVNSNIREEQYKSNAEADIIHSSNSKATEVMIKSGHQSTDGGSIEGDSILGHNLNSDTCNANQKHSENIGQAKKQPTPPHSQPASYDQSCQNLPPANNLNNFSLESAYVTLSNEVEQNNVGCNSSTKTFDNNQSTETMQNDMTTVETTVPSGDTHALDVSVLSEAISLSLYNGVDTSSSVPMDIS